MRDNIAMTLCVFSSVETGKHTCNICGVTILTKILPIRRVCSGHAPKKYLVGTILHDKLRDEFGVDYTKNCGCRQKIAMMNEWGPEGCREHLDYIVNGMLNEAKIRGWQLDGRPLLTVVAKIGAATPLGMYFARAWARKLVLGAIKESERSKHDRNST